MNMFRVCRDNAGNMFYQMETVLSLNLSNIEPVMICVRTYLLTISCNGKGQKSLKKIKL